MHTPHPHALSLNHRATWPAAHRLAVAAAVLSALLSACGGGGGGGGASEAAGVPNAGMTTATSAWAFPLGMSVGSPAELAASSEVIAGGLGVDDIGLRTTMSTQQAARSSQADAVARGRLSLSGSGLVDVDALFDTSARSHAPCYGPSVLYANHDNATGTNGAMPAGSVAMWRDTDTSGGTTQACATAELAAQTQGLSQQAHQAVLLMAALRQMMAADGSVQMPSPGTSIDLRNRATNLLSAVLGEASVQGASVALNADGSEYTYRLQLGRGSGSAAQTLEISVLHTPADTDTRYAGTLRLALSYQSTDAAIGCTDQMDSGRYKVARLLSLGYNRQDQWLSLRLRAGQYCGNPSSSTDQFGELAATAMSGELDPAVYVAGSVRGGTLGWRQGFVRMANDLLMSAQTSDFVYAWQDAPLGGLSHARLFAGHGTLDSSTQTRTLALFHGFTDDITRTDGTMRGMVCNWSGPGSTKTMQAAYQAQSLSLGSSATAWSLGSSRIRHAPTNSCSASNAMSFDLDGQNGVGSQEGAGFASELATPSGGAIDVQDDLNRQGFLSPVLLM